MSHDLERDDELPLRRSIDRTKPVPAAKIIGGLILGVLAGQLTIWWLPSDIRRDPLGLAKKLPAPIAFLAPSDLRSKTKISNSQPNNAQVKHPEDFTAPGSVASEEQNSTTNLIPPFAVPPQIAESSPSVTPLGPILTDEDTIAPDRVGRLIEFCMEDMRRLDTIELPERKDVANRLYDSLCDLGVRLFADDSLGISERSAEVENESFKRREVHLDATRTLLTAIGTAPERMVFVATAASKLAMADQQGVALAGEIQTIQEEIDGWTITIKDHRQRFAVQIEHAAMREQMHNGDQLIVLGVVCRSEEGDGPTPRILSAALTQPPIRLSLFVGYRSA